MNKRREMAINNLFLLLHETREAFLSGSRGCSSTCKAIMYGTLTMQMRSSRLLPKPAAPFPNLSYEGLGGKVLSFTSPQWAVPDKLYFYKGDLTAGITNHHKCDDSSFTSLFTKKLNGCIEGLDLDGLDPA